MFTLVLAVSIHEVIDPDVPIPEVRRFEYDVFWLYLRTYRYVESTIVLGESSKWMSRQLLSIGIVQCDSHRLKPVDFG